MSSSTTTPVLKALTEMELPDDLKEHVRQYCRKLGLFRKRSCRSIEEGVKLQYFYGGAAVAYLFTRDGIIIVAAGKRESPEFQEALDSLTPEQREKLVICWPMPWDDQISYLGPNFST